MRSPSDRTQYLSTPTALLVGVLLPAVRVLRRDAPSGPRHVLVLPHDDRQPAGGAELLLRVRVTGDDRLELGLPPGGVRLGSGEVLGTAVPEAAVDVDRDAAAPEHDVRATPARRARGRRVDEEPQAQRVQLPSQRQLRRRVPAAVALQHASHRLAAGRGRRRERDRPPRTLAHLRLALARHVGVLREGDGAAVDRCEQRAEVVGEVSDLLAQLLEVLRPQPLDGEVALDPDG